MHQDTMNLRMELKKAAEVFNVVNASQEKQKGETNEEK